MFFKSIAVDRRDEKSVFHHSKIRPDADLPCPFVAARIGEMRIPPLSPDKLSTPQQLLSRLEILLKQEFKLTGKSRTDGSRLRRLIQETLSLGPLPPEASPESYRIVPPRKKGVPRILREFLDTYIVTTGDSYNLQVWNRNPGARSVQVEYVTGERLLACDVRFVLGRVDPKRQEIRTLLILTPQYIESHFGPFGKPTIKQQLLISASQRMKISEDRERLFFRPDAASMKAHLATGAMSVVRPFMILPIGSPVCASFETLL